MPVTRCSRAWFGMPQLVTASYCACRVCQLVGSCRFSVLPKMRPAASWPAWRLVSVWAKKTSRYPWGFGSRPPTAAITSGAQPCMSAAPLRSGGGEHNTSEPLRPDQRYLLGDHAPDREAEQVDLLEAHRVREGDRAVGHLFDSARRTAAGAPDADVVEGDDAALRRKCVDQCGVPVVEVAAEVLQQHDRDVASTEVAIGVVDPILRRDPPYGGLGVLHVCGRRCHRERSFSGSCFMS